MATRATRAAYAAMRRFIEYRATIGNTESGLYGLERYIRDFIVWADARAVTHPEHLTPGRAGTLSALAAPLPEEGRLSLVAVEPAQQDLASEKLLQGVPASKLFRMIQQDDPSISARKLGDVFVREFPEISPAAAMSVQKWMNANGSQDFLMSKSTGKSFTILEQRGMRPSF